jgi:hypothetical protein
MSTMILKECVDSKYAAQAKHFAQTGGDPVSYSKLLSKKYKAALKRRGARNGHAEVAAK